MESPASPYKQSPIDTKFHIFTALINDTSTIPELNATIRSFAELDKENFALVKTENRFKNAIKIRKKEIQQPLLLEAQNIFDTTMDINAVNYNKGLGSGQKKIPEKFDVDLIRDGPNAKDSRGIPAIVKSVYLKNPKLLQILLDAGADPNLQFKEQKRTAFDYLFHLYGEIYHDNPIILKLANMLIDAGADPNTISTFNTTVLDDALDNNKEVARILIKHGAKTAKQLKEESKK